MNDNEEFLKVLIIKHLQNDTQWSENKMSVTKDIWGCDAALSIEITKPLSLIEYPYLETIDIKKEEFNRIKSSQTYKMEKTISNLKEQIKKEKSKKWYNKIF